MVLERIDWILHIQSTEQPHRIINYDGAHTEHIAWDLVSYYYVFVYQFIYWNLSLICATYFTSHVTLIATLVFASRIRRNGILRRYFVYSRRYHSKERTTRYQYWSERHSSISCRYSKCNQKTFCSNDDSPLTQKTLGNPGYNISASSKYWK